MAMLLNTTRALPRQSLVWKAGCETVDEFPDGWREAFSCREHEMDQPVHAMTHRKNANQLTIFKSLPARVIW